MTRHHHAVSSGISGQVVLDAFFLHALLRDKSIHGSTLTVPHHGLQRDRLEDVLMERNIRVAGTGQEMWGHACGTCMKIINTNDGSANPWRKCYPSVYSKPLLMMRPGVLSAGVVNGVTVGHACCSVHGCKHPLERQYHHFCRHHAHLRHSCRIEGCARQASAHHKTCDLPQHHDLELQKTVANKAMFQLRSRLRKLGVPEGGNTEPDVLLEMDDPLADDGAGGDQPNPPAVPEAETSGRKLRARFTRRWTHNEQLFVRCCGIIISRATFYGSEAIHGVKVSFDGLVMTVVLMLCPPGLCVRHLPS